MHQYTSNPFDKDVVYHGIDFFKSDSKCDDPKKDENGSENKKDEPNTDSKDDSKDDSKEDDKSEINVTGINKLIEMLLKIVEKILKLFK